MMAVIRVRHPHRLPSICTLSRDRILHRPRSPTLGRIWCSLPSTTTHQDLAQVLGRLISSWISWMPLTRAIIMTTSTPLRMLREISECFFMLFSCVVFMFWFGDALDVMLWLDLLNHFLFLALKLVISWIKHYKTYLTYSIISHMLLKHTKKNTTYNFVQTLQNITKKPQIWIIKNTT